MTNLERLLTFTKKALFPGKGVQHAQLVVAICNEEGLDSTRYLDGMYLSHPDTWGIEPQQPFSDDTMSVVEAAALQTTEDIYKDALLRIIRYYPGDYSFAKNTALEALQ